MIAVIHGFTIQSDPALRLVSIEASQQGAFSSDAAWEIGWALIRAARAVVFDDGSSAAEPKTNEAAQ